MRSRGYRVRAISVQTSRADRHFHAVQFTSVLLTADIVFQSLSLNEPNFRRALTLFTARLSTLLA